MGICLDIDELHELTGYKRGSDQARWLRSNGYYVECNARGIPRITHAQVEAKRHSFGNLQHPANQQPTEPTVLAFRQKLKRAG